MLIFTNRKCLGINFFTVNQSLIYYARLYKFRLVVLFTCANYTIKPVNNSTTTLARYEKSLNSFSARTSSLNRKSIPFSQFLLPVPCKRSSTVPIPFGFRLSVARSHCFVNLCAMLFYRHCPIRTPASIPALPWTTICAVVTFALTCSVPS